MLRRIVLILAVLVGLASPLLAGDRLAERLRRPTALVPFGDPPRLAVLNHRGGSISIVDRGLRSVIDEHSVGRSLVAGCWIGDGFLAVADDTANELLLVEIQDHTARVVSRQPLPPTPVNVIVAPDQQSCIVASTWARRLTVVSVSEPESLRIVKTIDLPFAPREICWIDAQRVVVADAFGGWVACVDPARGQILRCRELLATHNITSILLHRNGTEFYLSHQMLHGNQATTKPNVHWGDVMSNIIRRVNISWFLSDRPEETTAADLYYLGHPDSAAGDPTGLMVTASQQFIVGLAGVNQVAISDRGLNHFQRLDVGQRPVGLWLDAAKHELYVANYFDDSISIIDLNRRRVIDTISLGPSGPLTLADKGEQLFYDATLSSDGWFSCQSCHTDGHTNGHRSDTFGDGYRGSAKQVLSLLTSAETPPWAWNGKMPMLEEQIRKSIETTMRGAPPKSHEVQALAAYLMSLSPPPSLRASRGNFDAASFERGKNVFTELGCVDCHVPPTYTSEDVYDVGLVDLEGQRQFNPPSLLGVGHRQRLLHDGSAKNIAEALQVHPQGQGVPLSETQLEDLTVFLESL